MSFSDRKRADSKSTSDPGKTPQMQPCSQGPKWVTPPEIAKQLGIDPEKVLTWIRQGELSAVNVAQSPLGRPRWRIDPKDLEKFLDRRRATPPPPKVRRKRNRDDGVVQFYPAAIAA